MMESLQLLKIFLYVFLDLIPCLVLALVPYRAHFRFSAARTYGFGPLLFILIYISRILTLEGVDIARIFTAVWTGLYLGMYMACIKMPICILLFTLLTILNYGSFKAIIVNWIVYWLPVHPVGRYSFFSSLILLAVYAVTFPFMYGMMEKKIRPLTEQTRGNMYWRFLWLVPATFCLSYYYNLYRNGGTVAFSSEGGNVIFALILNFGALFVTFLILQLLKECNDKLLLEQENHYLAMQSVQYESLKYRIEEARQARHDLRQHLSVMQTFLQNGDYGSLSAYIHEYSRTLPLDSPIAYCEDYALNALIIYYEGMAGERGVRFSADVDYPPDSGILSSDAVILFGNLLENALEACCRELEGEPFIALRIRRMHDMIVAAVDNTCTADIPGYKDGMPSAKGARMGIGTVSIQKIAEKYCGTVQMKQENGIFYSSVLLNP
ncbi:MAG: ATP-binding protein [Lachnospiraceae bacterium]|nr:ATP-binding protein [Lachnospiraceae bacterium]